ncbi:hypothetical protein F2Q69_00061910 [Brassica cretica]|uniref:STL11/RBM22-like N-terminal domain-containing protein n=1 Tax=Brassica cretica TaxID=69181 RepID=A0A8S9RFB7_BRACR|nr:hypothetical protein F2Q69_00061910 [Brassica cretica]
MPTWFSPSRRDPTNPYLRIVLATYKKECKIRTRTFTMFRWQPGRTERYKKPEICQTYSKLKNICQVCLLDLENGLPVQDKDTAPNITTQEKEKHFSAVEEDINHKTSLLEKEKDQLRKLCLDDLRGQNLKCLAESDGLAVKKTKVEREHTSVKKGRVTKKTEYITREVFSIYPMKQCDNVREEKDAFRSQHKTNVEALNKEHSNLPSKIQHERVDLLLEREKLSEQEKKLGEERIQSLRLPKSEHLQVEVKRLENRKVLLGDTSTEVVKWEMAVNFEISNLEESGMEKYSMIHTPMKYGLNLKEMVML